MNILVFLVILKLTSAYYISDSPCIDRPIEQNFDVEKLAGRWYTISRYDNIYESGSHCGYGTYVFNNKTSLSTTDCEKVEGEMRCMHGIMYLSEPDRVPLEAKYKAILLLDSPQTLDDEFKILSTDYVNYFLMYDCKNIEDGKSRNLFWIISRKTTLDESVKEYVDKIIDKYFVRSELRAENQDPELCEPRV